MKKFTPIAYLCTDRQVHIIDQGGVHHAKSQPGGHMNMAWWAVSGHDGSYAWPTWSPNGKTVASFHCTNNDQKPRIVLMEADGICSEELAILEGRLPIYLQWDQAGENIAVLCQDDEHLQLSCVKPGAIGHETKLTLGSPMFFTWAEDRIALFAGTDESSPELQLVDPSQERPPIIMPHLPGNFCAPLWVDNELVYVASTETTGPHIYASSLRGTHKMLDSVDGLTALVASPKGRLIARATAHAGDGTPYNDLSILDLQSSKTTKLTDKPCMAFMWCPNGDALVFAHVNTKRNLLEWYHIDLDGNTTHLIDLRPTRDLGFYLRFFEQYCQSHLLIDGDGKALILAGTKPSASGKGDQPSIWKVPLTGGPAKELAKGMFAVFAPS